MIPRVQERERVIALRRKGLTYREILERVSVSKSSVSSWLRDTPLSKSEKHLLKERKDVNISRGRIRAAASLRGLRLKRDACTYTESKKEFDQCVEEPLFQLGVGLYWAEGSKRNSSFAFMNSDPHMIKVMIFWIETYLGVSRDDIGLRLYTHKPFERDNLENFWSNQTGIPPSNFRKTIYKPTGLLVKKRPGYKGCLRIELGKVIYLRKLRYWQQMLIEHYEKKG